MNNYDLGCCKCIKTTNYVANIYVTRIKRMSLFSIQLIPKKPYSDRQISCLLKAQKYNIYDSFLEEYKDDPRWILSPSYSAKEVERLSAIPGFLTKLSEKELLKETNFGFELKDLYKKNKLEKQLILDDYHSCSKITFLTEPTLMMLQVIKFLRDFKGTPYMDL